jgi:hypothetical protein
VVQKIIPWSGMESGIRKNSWNGSGNRIDKTLWNGMEVE